VTNRDAGLVGPDGRSAIGRLTGDDSIYDMVEAAQGMVLSPEAAEGVERTMKALRGQEDQVRAQFLMDVMFNKGRSAHRPYDGLIVAYTNGGFAHGGGDEMIYFCPRHTEKNGQTKVCAAPLPPIAIQGKTAVCPVCRQVSRDRELIGQVYAKLTTQNWATLVSRMFYRLDCNADLRICILKGDLHRATEDEREKSSGGDKLYKVYDEHQWVRYSLSSMIRDTTSGATLDHCINMFLRA
jgi:hypothetical protein